MSGSFILTMPDITDPDATRKRLPQDAKDCAVFLRDIFWLWYSVIGILFLHGCPLRLF
jgi:hypothetical protein